MNIFGLVPVFHEEGKPVKLAFHRNTTIELKRKFQVLFPPDDFTYFDDAF